MQVALVGHRVRKDGADLIDGDVGGGNGEGGHGEPFPDLRSELLAVID
jgi:hypothetical protein